MEFIHWVNGMKINNSHFIGLENSIASLVSKSVNHINENNFGLLLNGKEIKSLAIVEGDKVVVSKCQGFTPSGFFFDLPTNKISESIKGEDEVIYIYLDVNYQRRDEIGIGDFVKGEPKEKSRTYYEFKLRTEKALQLSSSSIPICRIKIVKDIIMKDEEFIPPVLFFGNNYELLNNDNFQFLKFIESCWNSCIRLLKKSNKSVSSLKSSESKFITQLCNALLLFLAGKIDELKIRGERLSPRDFYLFCMSLKRLQIGIVQSISEEEYQSIFSKYKNFSEFLSFFASLKNEGFYWVDYNHLEMNDNINNCRTFLLKTRKLLNVLDRIDLNPSKKTRTESDI